MTRIILITIINLKLTNASPFGIIKREKLSKFSKCINEQMSHSKI